MSFGLRPCGQGRAVCEGDCDKCGTTATMTTDGYWYHGNGKIGGEFHPTKPNDEERYGEYVKVKHGHWKHHQYGNTAGYYECDNCGKISSYESNYCPYCGAKMDGGEE
ncbi:MAG: hypothetical protein II207_05020 [Clostridia bacterium]|nr:hypothetical protein [Clostridia bacterium]